MSPARAARFLLVALAAATVMNLAWPLVANGYRAVFLGSAETFFGRFGSDRVVEFHTVPRKGIRGADSAMLPRLDSGPSSQTVIAINTYRQGYFPTTVLLALFVATRAPRERRLRLLPVGLLLLHGFLAFRLAMALTYGFATVDRADGSPALAVEGWGLVALGRVTGLAWHELHPNYLVPLILWGVVMGRSPLRVADQDDSVH